MNNKLAPAHKFNFDSYRLDENTNTVYFNYSFDNGHKFTETLNWGEGVINWQKNRTLINNILFNLHLVLGIGYYKAFCPPQIVIKSGSLTKPQADFWNKLYTKGLGEFFYRNKIDSRGLINFPFIKSTKNRSQALNLKDRCLVGAGGGKDSCVAAERLRELGHDFSLISLGDSEVQRATAKLTGAKRLVIRRQLDPALLTLNKAGAYNGHVPISATFAWVTVLSAVLFNYRHLVFANEASASYGNVRYLGEEINHQYSKSLEFENDLRAYLKDFISPDLNYFSLLRPLSELAIVKLFTHYPKYFPAFSSCNRNFSQTRPIKTRWCNECPKCAFIFSQLAAWLPKRELIKIFGENLFQKKSLLPIFQELWGEKRFKPFECVGTPDEVKAAFLLAGAKADWRRDFIPAYFAKKIKPRIKNPGRLLNDVLKLNSEHNLPENFRPTIILGFGQEGHFAYKYLRARYPNFKFSVSDQNKIILGDKNVKLITGPNYLQSLAAYERIIKSPGLSDRLAEISAQKNSGRELTSVTNIFFDQAADQTIGVTGTKGKSTTASLIYEILKAGKKNVKLVGNIGADPLPYLKLIETRTAAETKPKNRKQSSPAIFVYELSSHQLSLANKSPHVAVMINIFPDHLPYHGGFKNYFQAKTNITNFQGPDDFFVFNRAYPALKKLAATSQAQPLDYLGLCSQKNGWLYYGQEKIIPLKEIKLPGLHNLQNIMAAISVAKLYNIPTPAIQRTLKNFRGLPHRLEFVGSYWGLDFYDDAISTTPESTLAALSVFKEKIGALILGGEDRGYNFKALAEEIIKLKIKNIVLLPTSGVLINRALKVAAHRSKSRTSFFPKLFPTTNMDAALKFIYQNTPPGHVVLLSTASPSYSLYKNFIAKGLAFQAALKKFGQNRPQRGNA